MSATGIIPRYLTRSAIQMILIRSNTEEHYILRMYIVTLCDESTSPRHRTRLLHSETVRDAGRLGSSAES